MLLFCSEFTELLFEMQYTTLSQPPLPE